MDEPGLVEFHYPDGYMTRDDFTLYSFVPRHKGDHLVHAGVDWLIFDREDRAGVPVYLCKPT